MTHVLGAQLPSGWPTSKLKLVTSFLSRGTAPNYVDYGPVRVIGQAANQADGIDWSRTRFHDHSGDPTTLKGHLHPGDVLINSTGTGTLGRVGYFSGPPDALPCMADGHVSVVRFAGSEVYSRFAYYWLSSQPFREYVYAALVVGATNQIELSRERLADAPIPLPPLEEQRRIADFLDAEIRRMDDIQARQQSVLSLLLERDMAVVDNAIDQATKSFGRTPFRRFISRIEQGISPLCDNTEASLEEWGVLKVSAVKNGSFDPHENKRLPDEHVPPRRYEIRHGDLLVTRANTPALVGSAAVVHHPRQRLLLCDKIFRIEVHPDLNKDYVALVAQGSRIRSLCAEASHGASQSMANLKTENIKEWPIPFAPPNAQLQVLTEVGKELESTKRLRSLIDTQLKVMAERRQALITAAVIGQFDVTTARGGDLS